jgi:hypothetical protein
MKGLNRSHLALGLLVIAGASGMAVKASAQATSLTLTAHVFNYAGVNSKTLADSEKFATAVFHISGVEIRWVTVQAPAGQKEFDPKSFDLDQIRVNILPKKMADLFGFPGDGAGYAPGTGHDRQLAYVLYDKVEALAQNPASIAIQGLQYCHVNKSIILGMALAHEIGHLLLNLESHSPTGIMRANWNMDDLLEASRGNLAFTTQQAASVRADVAQRMVAARVSSNNASAVRADSGVAAIGFAIPAQGHDK